MINMMLVFTVIISMLFLGQQVQHQHQSLEFRLSAEKPAYVVYEPLKLNLELINQGDQPVQGIFSSFTFQRRELKLFYRRKGVDFKKYYNVKIWVIQGKGYETLEPQPLKPGRRVSTEQIVLFDTWPYSDQEDRFVFDQPGEYEFKATFQYITGESPKEIESNVLTLTVRPAPPEERAALAWWTRKDMALIIQDEILGAPDLKTDSVIAFYRLRKFLESFPNSLYASYARTSQEGWVGYLQTRAKEEKWTEEERKVYEVLRPKN